MYYEVYGIKCLSFYAYVEADGDNNAIKKGLQELNLDQMCVSSVSATEISREEYQEGKEKGYYSIKEKECE